MPYNPGRQKTTSNFINLQTLLGLNQGTGAQLGQRLAQESLSGVDAAGKAIDNLDNNIRTETEAGRTNLPGLSTDSLVNVNEDNYRASYDPNRVAERNQALVNATTARYTGPDSVESVAGYEDADKAVNNVRNNDRALTTEYGRAGLLDKIANSQDYTGGQRALDDLYATQSDGGKKALGGARDTLKGVQDRLGIARNQFSADKQSAEYVTAQTNRRAQEMLNEADANYRRDVTARQNEWDAQQERDRLEVERERRDNIDNRRGPREPRNKLGGYGF